MGGDVIGKINYIVSTTDGCPPWLMTYSVATTKRSNFVQESVDMTIHDLRNKEENVSLDANALEVLKYNGSMQEEFEGGSEAQQKYFAEIADILKKHLGASRVIVYHHSFRFRTTPLADEQCDDNHRNPVYYPHVDIDSKGVQNLIKDVLEKEGDGKGKVKRAQVMNVWRPLGPNPITNNPLTICDYASLDVDKDVDSMEIRGSHHHHNVGHILSRNAQDAHVWYYLSRMQSDEMFVFKMYDSNPDAAHFAFHTAFPTINEPTSNEEQRSLEVRCLIFYNEQ